MTKNRCLENPEHHFCCNHNETALNQASLRCNNNLCAENIPLQGILNVDFLASRKGLTYGLRRMIARDSHGPRTTCAVSHDPRVRTARTTHATPTTTHNHRAQGSHPPRKYVCLTRPTGAETQKSPQTPEPPRLLFDSPVGAQSFPHSATPLAVPPVRMPLCDRHGPCSPHDPHARTTHARPARPRALAAADRGASARMRLRTARRPRVSRSRGKARTRRRRTRPAPRRACARGR